jgi:threonyl-tRNA synthetase
MFTTESENRSYALKPMNCPGHVQIFNSGLRSYRDLPLRYGEFGQCHRNEPSGALHGIMRVRGFTQDDGHVFCHRRPDPRRGRPSTPRRCRSTPTSASRTSTSSSPAAGFARRHRRDLGQAEEALRSALRACGVEWTELPGEGAFYGPKIEYHLKDCLGRPWQVGTMQVDFSCRAPGRRIRRGRQRPQGAGHAAPRHRRFAGALHRHPDRELRRRAAAWLAPQQVAVLNISDAQADYAQTIVQKLRDAGLRAYTRFAQRENYL